jgi:hypothetical protein
MSAWEQRRRFQRFGYSDLKEAALSGASGLWELNRRELLVAAKKLVVLVF